jgi:cytidylate kinase
MPKDKFLSGASAGGFAAFFQRAIRRRSLSSTRRFAAFHKPEDGFEIQTYCGKFEDAVSEIQTFIGSSFPLIFIDPTGWTGYLR